MARPPLEFSQPIADEILERIAHGEDLTRICKSDSVPSLPTVYKWLHSNAAFAEGYTHAREIQAEGLAAEAQEIATRTHVTLPNGMSVPIDTNRDRLIVDTIKWRAAHLRPKVWGDKQFVEHSGSLTLIDATEEDLLAELVELVSSGRLVLPEGAELVEDEPEEFDHDSLA